MASRDHRMNLDTLHAIALMVAQARSVDSVLETVVESLVDKSDLALARIWLVSQGDICPECYVRNECPDQSRCLHLVASAVIAARPQNLDSGDEWYRKDGYYRRFPLGVRRIGEIAATGQSLKLSDTAEDASWFARGDWLQRERVRAFCGHPLISHGDVLGVLAVFSRSLISEQEFAWLQAFADTAAVAISNARAFEEIEALKSQLELENEYLRDEIRHSNVLGGIVGQSPGLHKVLTQVELVAPTDTSVLILGESGVGKELIARGIHAHGPRQP